MPSVLRPYRKSVNQAHSNLGIPYDYNYNFAFKGELDHVSGEHLPAANYEGAHQRLNLLTGEIEDFTADEYVRGESGYPITCGGWKELCLQPVNPLLWVKSGALDIEAAAGSNIGSFVNAGKITDNGNVTDRYLLWRSSTSGAPTGIHRVKVHYVEDTSGEVRITFTDATAGIESVYAGEIGAATVTSQAAGALTLVSDIEWLGGRLATFLVNFTNKANTLTIGIGPNSTDGSSIIARGASVAGAIGTGDITTERPFTNGNPGNVVTWSSLSADLTNGRGPRVTYADAPKLLTALQGASTNAQGQIEWTGEISSLPASASALISCNTTTPLLQVGPSGEAIVSDGTYSATLANAFVAGEKTKIIIPYQPGVLKVIKGATSTVTGFDGSFNPGTLAGLGAGTPHATHESWKVYKRPRISLGGLMTTVYSGTVSGMRISAVAGTAFLDNLPAEILALADGNHLIEVTDAAGKKIVGVMAAVGTGETLGSELVTAADDRTFASDTGWWTKGTGWSIGSNVASHAGGAGGSLSRNSLFPANALVNFIYTSSSTFLGLTGVTVPGGHYVSGSTNTKKTTGGANCQFYCLTTASTLDNVSVKQVLTPSTSGITLVSYLGSSVQSPMYADPTFAYNQVAAYGVTVKKMEA